jgi:CDP-paratose 2-epimerase
MVLREIEALTGNKPSCSYAEIRGGDQPYFVADTRCLSAAVGWQPRVAWRAGLRDLCDWLRSGALAPAALDTPVAMGIGA